MKSFAVTATALALSMGYCGQAAAGAFVLSGGSGADPTGQVLAITRDTASPALPAEPAVPQIHSLPRERLQSFRGVQDLTQQESARLTSDELSKLIDYAVAKSFYEHQKRQVEEAARKAAEDERKPVVSAKIDTSTETASIAAALHFDEDLRFTTNDKAENFLSFKVATPLEAGQTSADLVTLDGLTQSTSISLTGSRLWGNLEDDKPKWLFSVDGSVGYDPHDYFDPATLAKLSTTTSPWQAGLSLEFSPEGNKHSFTFSAEYQQSFVDGGGDGTQTRCLSDLTCVTGFVGAPVRQDNALLSLAWRYGVDDTAIPFGIAPVLTYDPIQDAEAVSVPLYFATDDDGKLTGGVRYDWNSVTHVSTVGVFVSTAFSVL